MKKDFKLDYKLHPGEYLNDVLKSRSITRKKFSKQLGISYYYLSSIINGQKLLTEDLIIKLEKELSIVASLWSNLNKQYIK